MKLGDLVRLVYTPYVRDVVLQKEKVGIIVGIKQSEYGFPPATYSIQWSNGTVGCVASVDIEVINESR